MISSQNIDKKVYILQIMKKTNCLIESWFLSYKKGIQIVNLKKPKKVHVTILSFYSVFNMSSSRMPEIQNGLPKITKIKWICYFF